MMENRVKIAGWDMFHLWDELSDFTPFLQNSWKNAKNGDKD